MSESQPTPTDKPTPPTPPEDWECCGSECGDACVYEIHAQEKQAYEQALKQWQAEQPK